VLRERFAEITAMDRAIGVLRDHLEANGMRENTILWYCGDNGTPAEGQVAAPLRGRKGQMYEGGIRVPGLIEWPARIPAPRTTRVEAVTSDILPTLCALTGQPAPARPLDGINLTDLIDGKMKRRPEPIFFWAYDTRHESALGLEPYIDPELQRGTTPLVKLMGDLPTRNFRNDRHPEITDEDFAGERVVLENDYKLVVRGPREPSRRELYHLIDDPAEATNLIQGEPDRAANMERQLRDWQQSVLNSLTGADYR
jgi:arylsulfatase A-like enzyme